MIQCPIEKLTLLERGLVVRQLAERDELQIIDADNKIIYDRMSVSRQGNKIQITVTRGIQ
jgi:hypothetical protein